jgi:uncharacterized membrane protein YozB (DUF420 family)/cytochrome oxidase Cu insertion factor (SCO1/SenC/PrrC family)
VGFVSVDPVIMQRTIAILSLFFAAGSLCAQGDKNDTSIDYPVGNFSLQDRTGKYITARDLRGSIWVAHFFFPECTGACTKSPPNMKKLQDHFRGKPNVKFVSIALHGDTLETLNRYAEAQNAEPGQWYFLTDENEERVHEIIRLSFFDTAVKNDKPTPGNEIVHSSRLILIDPAGMMVSSVEGTKDNAFDLMKTEIDRLRLQQRIPVTVADMPWFNALLNSACTILLLLGWVAIRLRYETVHKILMLLALTVSMVFLASYLFYHFVVVEMQPTRFPGEGVAKFAYLAILLTHTILAIVVAPLALTITVQGLRDARKIHVKLAKWTLPMWLYVSITGVVVYWMLYRVNW